MTEPTIKQIFGINARQDAANVILLKADWEAIGLTKKDVQSAEGIFVAVLLLAQKHLNEVNRAIGNPEISIVISQDFETLVVRDSQKYREYTFTIKLQKLDTSSVIKPDDF